MPKRDNQNLENLSSKWVPFFRDSGNVFINDLALRYRRTTTMASIVNSKHNYAMGEFTYMVNGEAVGVDDLPDDFKAWAEEVNSDGQNLRDVVSDAMFNWIFSGNTYTEVVRSGDFTGAQVIDSTKVRVAVDKASVFVSAFWRDIGMASNNQGRHPVAQVESWDRNSDTSQPRFVIHTRRKVPEFDFYGLPDYLSTLKDADIEYKVDTYNLDRLENGMFPTLSVTAIGEPPEGMTAQQYVEALNSKFSGEGRGGKNFIQLVDDESQAAKIAKLSNDNEGEFLNLEDSAIKGQARGHRWPNVLSNIETAGKLGNNQEVINQWRIAMNNLVVPDYQTPVLRVMNQVIKIAGFDVKLGMINKPPVSLEHMVEGKFVLDINEQRVELGKAAREELEGKYLEQSKAVSTDGNDNTAG